MTRACLMAAVLAAAIAAPLSGCSTSSVYHPAEYAGGEGFSERKLSDDQYRVTFRGRDSTSREMVEDYLLLHAAEIALREGRKGFRITEADTDAETRIRGYSRPAFYGRSVHYDPFRRSFPYYAYGYDWGYPDRYARETGYAQTREYVAVAYIALTDTLANGDPRAFDASQVIASIGPVSCYRHDPHDEASCPFAHDHD